MEYVPTLCEPFPPHFVATEALTVLFTGESPACHRCAAVYNTLTFVCSCSIDFW